MNPWLELRFTARGALRGERTVKAAALAAERCSFMPVQGGPRAYLHNALKSLCHAWPDLHGVNVDHPIGWVLCTLDDIERAAPPPPSVSKPVIAGDAPANRWWMRE